ncbi:MAG TPA: autotransporter-associated beta strand repeat-containing protein, partial [Candidatus Sulfotelmatobacter sp.]|nr:autotransporter-associated beta strand repeat-containing protein [Candidatus Sulfotelmatobacter sp.]
MKTPMKIPAFPFHTFLVLAALFGATATASAAGQAVWQAVVGVSADTNWSDLNNWEGGVNPNGNNCVFNDATGVGNNTTINNVVSTPENPSSLTYTNIGTFQNTLILPGNTLTIGTGGLTMGNTTAFAGYPATSPTTTISGPGATLVASNDTITLGYSFSSTTPNGLPTLNMSGLDHFVATNMNHIYIGEGSVRMSGVLYLAATNYVYFTGASSSSSPNLDIGDNSGNNGPGSALYLGQTNVFWVNDIGMGLKKQNSGSGGQMLFNTSFNNPVACFYGTNGPGSLVATWAIGDGQATGGTPTCQGTADFAGGTVYASVNNMWLGRSSSAESGGSPINSGTLTFAAGMISVNNMTNGWITSAQQPSTTAEATINVGGTGVLSVAGNLVLAITNNGLSDLSSNAVEAQAELMINGGTVLANKITTGGMGNSGSGYGALIYMTGGLLAVTNTMGSSAFPLNYLELASSPTLQLGVAENVTNCQVQDLVSDGSTTVVNISSLPVVTAYPTLYPLITYQSEPGGALAFSLGTMPGTYTGNVYDDGSGTVWLDVTGGPALPKLDEWGGGVNDNWDTTTLNWTNNGSAVAYAEGDSALFNDAARTATVSLTAPHTPLSWSVTNNVLNYTFTGSGVQGSVGLVKSGTATVTLSESGDSFSGGISVLGGTVVLDQSSSSISGGLSIAAGATAQIGNNDANGTLPAGTLANIGTLAYDQTIYALLPTAISGAGGLTQEGSGTLALSAANTYTGNTLVSGGTLALTNAGSISDSTVTVNGATLDVSGVTGVTTLSSLSLNNASINVSAGYLQAPVLVTNLTMGGAGNTINVISLPGIASYPTTVTLIQSPNSISGSDISLGTLPAASPSYAGSVSVSGNQVVLTLSRGPTGVRPYVTWSGTDVPNHNTNWSDNANWQLPGAPVASDYVIFDDVAAAAGTPYSAAGSGPGGVANPTNINNIVNSSFTISELGYSNVLSDYQNTFLNNGVTLSAIGTNTSPRLFTVGTTATDFGGGVECHATIGGAGGTLNFQNTNGMIYVGLGDANDSTEQAVLDMSGLGAFNAAVSQIYIGVGSSSGGIGLGRESGVVYLAQTNTITVSLVPIQTEANDETASLSIDVGDDDGSAGAPSAMYLGQTNAIYAEAVGVGQQKATGAMEFNPYYTNTDIVPVAYFRGVGGGAMTVLSIGDGVVNSGTANCKGTCDFTTASGGSDGYVNALVTTLYVGRAADNTASGGEAVGTLSFDKGVFDVATAYVGYQPTNSSKYGIGTVNVGASGTLTVSGTLYLGLSTGGAGAVTNSGALLINGGTANLNNVVCGTGGSTNTISLNGGTLAVTGAVGAPGAGL